MSSGSQARPIRPRGSMKQVPDDGEEIYMYDKLVSTSSIRLFDLQHGSPGSAIIGTLRQVDLTDEAHTAPEYTALSYAWGSPKDRVLPIWVNDKLFRVRDNLFTALQALRDAQVSRTLWIDALCISQDNVSEKNHQVSLMARIFRTADKVVVWLGPIDDECRLAFEYMRSNQKIGSDDLDADEKPSPILIRAITSVLQRKYWSRAWIVQEVILSQKIELACGTAVLAWTKFAQTCKLLWQYLPTSQALHLLNQRTAIQNDERILLDQTLESLIRTYRRCECSNRRDRVFALLALAFDCASSHGIHADYAISRFQLLVSVLEFCRPDDPVDFVSVLFQAFTMEEGDVMWRNACTEWDKGRLPAQDVNYLSEADTFSAEKETVHITHLVAALSASRDWVRYHSFAALLDTQYIAAHSREIASSTSSFIQRSLKTTSGKGYNESVVRIDDSNVAIVLHKSRVAILSTTQIAATVNPCGALGLHEEPSACTWAQCAKLKIVGNEKYQVS